MRLISLSLLCVLFNLFTIQSQEKKTAKRWGVQFGLGTQQAKPFHSLDYDYQNAFILGQIQLKNFQLNKINLSILAEGGYYKGQHKLINKWFAGTDKFDGFPDDFQQQMLKEKDLHQLAIHLAAELSYYVKQRIMIYFYSAIGPLWTSKQTERLAAGFAFSDNIGIGYKLRLTRNTWLDNSMVLRHESNADLKFPNSGHNTLGVRLGLVFNLNPPQRVVALQQARQKL
ncbi:MAG: acyloxyacyl hydrolase [Flavobacteriaceae bacterium]|nr:acyloxyacyl hydrolase [Flavobacteriaceae bacterium]